VLDPGAVLRLGTLPIVDGVLTLGGVPRPPRPVVLGTPGLGIVDCRGIGMLDCGGFGTGAGVGTAAAPAARIIGGLAALALMPSHALASEGLTTTKTVAKATPKVARIIGLLAARFGIVLSSSLANAPLRLLFRPPRHALTGRRRKIQRLQRFGRGLVPFAGNRASS
jgi:hypothetical protein